MITRKQVLLECLQRERKNRDQLREHIEEMKKEATKTAKDMLESFEQEEMIAQQKVEILQELIQAYDNEIVRSALADWQKDLMAKGIQTELKFDEG